MRFEHFAAMATAWLLLLLTSACSGRGNYAAQWTLGGTTLVCSDPDASKLAPARCAAAGIDAVQIEIRALDQSLADLSLYACGLCAPVLGPSLAAGTYTMRAEPMGVEQRALGNPPGSLAIEQQLIITAGMTSAVAFNLQIPPQCSNGIDDDGNGLIDALDPSCMSPDQAIEGSSDGGVADGSVADGGDGGATDVAVSDVSGDVRGDRSDAAVRDAGPLDAAADVPRADAPSDVSADHRDGGVPADQGLADLLAGPG